LTYLLLGSINSGLQIRHGGVEVSFFDGFVSYRIVSNRFVRYKVKEYKDRKTELMNYYLISLTMV
jgi:hypothetical protein